MKWGNSAIYKKEKLIMFFCLIKTINKWLKSVTQMNNFPWGIFTKSVFKFAYDVFMIVLWKGEQSIVFFCTKLRKKEKWYFYWVSFFSSNFFSMSKVILLAECSKGCPFIPLRGSRPSSISQKSSQLKNLDLNSKPVLTTTCQQQPT